MFDVLVSDHVKDYIDNWKIIQNKPNTNLNIEFEVPIFSESISPEMFTLHLVRPINFIDFNKNIVRIDNRFHKINIKTMNSDTRYDISKFKQIGYTTEIIGTPPTYGIFKRLDQILKSIKDFWNKIF